MITLIMIILMKLIHNQYIYIYIYIYIVGNTEVEDALKRRI